MIKIVLSAKDYDNNCENTLKVTINGISSLIRFENYGKEYSFSTQDLDSLICKYTDNYGSGENIQMRELYNSLELSEKNKIDRDLARIFIISCPWMHFGNLSSSTHREIIIKSIKEGIRKFLDDTNIPEWTGDTGTQPGIYFLKNEYKDNYKDAIEKFYNLGLLYKYILEIDNEKYVNFIFPFIDNDETSIRKFDLIPYIKIWNKIVKDRNKDIINFINGTRNKW